MTLKKPEAGDILQCSMAFALDGGIPDDTTPYLVTETALGSGMDVFANIPARADSSTWSGSTVYSLYKAFWWASNTDSVDRTLHILADFAGVGTAEYAMEFQIPAGETVAIAHGMPFAATSATPIYMWADAADVVNVRGHTTRWVTLVTTP